MAYIFVYLYTYIYMCVYIENAYEVLFRYIKCIHIFIYICIYLHAYVYECFMYGSSLSSNTGKNRLQLVNVYHFLKKVVSFLFSFVMTVTLRE